MIMSARLWGNHHFFVINDHLWGPSVHCGQILQKNYSRGQTQGPAGRDFQLPSISGSGIAKNFGFGSGIGYIFKKNYQSGIFGY